MQLIYGSCAIFDIETFSNSKLGSNFFVYSNRSPVPSVTVYDHFLAKPAKLEPDYVMNIVIEKNRYMYIVYLINVFKNYNNASTVFLTAQCSF